MRSLAVCLTAVLLAGTARADISVGASPAFLDLSLDPGKTTAQTILLFNSGKDPVTVKAYAWDWWHEENNPRKFGPPGTLPNSAAKWISFVPETITVSPQKAVNVTVVLNTPAEAKAGNYAVAWFEAIPEKNAKAKEVLIGARLGVLVMTEVRGQSRPGIRVDNVKVTPPSDAQLMQADLTLVNSGDVHLFARGTLVLMNKARKLVGHTTFEKRRLLPGESSPVSIKWGGELDPGDYQALFTVDYGDAGSTVKTVDFKVPIVARH
ncbi:MAG: hypothetical protein ACKVPX_13555 [Myxococcaceae bacterium]